jgi:ribosomal-protein-alanine N-acetyltransferase
MLELYFDPFPLLETERLVLRKISMSDAADMFAIRSNNEAMKYICRPLLHSISEAQNLIGGFQDGIRSRSNIVWGISIKNQSRLIGTIGFHRIDKDNLRAEIGYVLDPAYWGQGYASEAVATILDYGFVGLGLHSVEARVDPRNTDSGKVLLKHNFTQEAHFKESLFFDGNFIDVDVYSLIRAVK